MQNAQRHVKCTFPGSECTSMSETKVADRKMVAEEAETLEDGMFINQDGGNDLEETGVEETVSEQMEAVKVVENRKMSVAVVGVLRRLQESERYERMRKTTNR